MRKNSVYAGCLPAQKLFINSGLCPQAAPATASMGTNTSLTPSLYERAAQLCAQYFFVFNSLITRLITTVHRPNNDYNKGE